MELIIYLIGFILTYYLTRKFFRKELKEKTKDMNLIIVTNPELGWDCVMAVYDASKISEEDVQKAMPRQSMNTPISEQPRRRVLGSSNIESVKETFTSRQKTAARIPVCRYRPYRRQS